MNCPNSCRQSKGSFGKKYGVFNFVLCSRGKISLCVFPILDGSVYLCYILNDQIWLGTDNGYSKNSIYIVGCAKAAAENPITVASQYLILPIIFDRDSGQIYDADINSVCDITERFVKSLLVGRSIYTDYNAIIQDIGSRYLGHSQKALIFCIRNIIHTLQEQSMLPQHSG